MNKETFIQTRDSDLSSLINQGIKTSKGLSGKVTRRRFLIKGTTFTAGFLLACKKAETEQFKKEQTLSPTATTTQTTTPTPTKTETPTNTPPATSIDTATPIATKTPLEKESVIIVLSKLERILAENINDARINEGLNLLLIDKTLAEIARQKSSDMVDRNYFSHTSPEGKKVKDLLDDASYPYDHADETLARNNARFPSTANVAMRNLMASPGHKKIILNPNYTHLGVGEDTDFRGMHFFTMIFADKIEE